MLALALVLPAACSSGKKPPKTPTPRMIIALTPGAEPTSGPPHAKATFGGASVDMVVGTYYWDGVRADAYNVVTRPEALAVQPGASISVANPVPDLKIVQAGSRSVPATEEPTALAGVGTGLLQWSFGATFRIADTKIEGDGITFKAEETPGRYITIIYLRYDDRETYYAFLTDVQGP
jgi:hypothetical protein